MNKRGTDAGTKEQVNWPGKMGTCRTAPAMIVFCSNGRLIYSEAVVLLVAVTWSKVCCSFWLGLGWCLFLMRYLCGGDAFDGRIVESAKRIENNS